MMGMRSSPRVSPTLLSLLALALGGGAALATPQCLEGQTPAPRLPVDVRHEVFAGGELERYLRAIHTLGDAPPLPWGIRGFSAEEVAERAAGAPVNPWGDRYRFTAPDEDAGFRWGVVTTAVRGWYRSDRPDPTVEGPVWAGKGLTTSLTGGVWVSWGPLSLTLAPVAFRAENTEFDMVPIPGGEERRFRHPLDPVGMDLPQRFGDEAYQRLDPGYSTLRLNTGPLTAGVSTAALTWGPMERFPMLMGNTAGGFPHLFLGTRRPVSIGVGELHARYVFGKLGESEHSPAVEAFAERSGAGVVFLFRPRGLTGLEVGITRFIHRDWTTGEGLARRMRQPLDFRFKGDIPDYDLTPDNQMASLVARWTIPGTGFEIFAEYLRGDHVNEVRTLFMEPDDLGGHVVGFRKGWKLEGERVLSLNGEAFTAQSSHRERGGARLDLRDRALLLYRHSLLTQGHTLNGLPFAPAGATAGHGVSLQGDLYTPEGRWSVALGRLVRSEDASVTALGVPDLTARTETHLAAGARRFRGDFEFDGRVEWLFATGSAPRSGLHLEFGGRFRLP